MEKENVVSQDFNMEKYPQANMVMSLGEQSEPHTLMSTIEIEKKNAWHPPDGQCHVDPMIFRFKIGQFP